MPVADPPTDHSSTTGFDDASLVVQSLPVGSRKVVKQGGHFGRYVSGHLVYVHRGTFFAAPFDLARLEPTGPAVPVLDGVASNADVSGSAQFATSANGLLAYIPGKNVSQVPMSWLSRDGKTTPLRSAAANWTNVHMSPDGRRVAMDINVDGRTDMWVYEEARDSLSRVTSGSGDSEHPVWTPDGLRIVFAHRDKSVNNLFWRRADGTGNVQRLTTAAASQHAASWHPSMRFLALAENTPQNRDDLLILRIEGDESTEWKPGKLTVFLSTPFAEREPMFSPDGRWIAYNSNETGIDEIYVRPFPGPGGKWKVSSGGGETPTWSRARRELLYAAPEQRIMVVPYSVPGDSFVAENPQPWFELRFVPRRRSGPTRSYDLHPDGNRIALALASEAGPRPSWRVRCPDPPN